MMQLDLASAGGIVVGLLPEIVLTVWTLALMLVAAWRHGEDVDQRRVGQLTLLGIAAAALAVLWLWSEDAQPAGLPLMISLDTFRYVTGLVFLLASALSVLLSLGYLGRERIVAPEYYVLLLLSTIGMMFMGGAADLLVVFLGLELMSIPVYVLAAVNRRSRISAEAGMKYFFIGAFASAFLLYGIALVYGATGTTNLAVIDLQVGTAGAGSNLLLLLGLGMLLIGFGFKVAAIPFHMWTPDVYEGAPTPVTAFMAAGVKAAAFAAFARILISALGNSVDLWQEALWWLSVITMVGGNLMALAQRRVKRMLAYSSIAHAGYLLVALTSGTEMGAGAFLFYILAYTLMTIGAFAVLTAMGTDGERDVSFDDFSGLAAAKPWLALVMSVFLLSLLGFPGTAGFIGKWYIISSAVRSDQAALAVVLVLASVVSAGYYLPIIMNMYMRPASSEKAHAAARLAAAARWVVAVAAVSLVLFGFWPNRALDVAEQGGATLRPDVVFALD